MAAQIQKQWLTEVFGIFYRLLTQNSTNQDSRFDSSRIPCGRPLENPKT